MEENYLENIRVYIISEQARTIVKDYNANKSKLETYYNIGKELAEAGKHYGEGIVKTYAEKLTKEFGKGFQYKELYKMLQFYNLIEKVGTVCRQLTWSHYRYLLSLKNLEEVKYYIDVTIRNNLSVRELIDRIKSDEYGRLPLETKLKLKEEKEVSQVEVVPSTILIPCNKTKEQLTEKVLEEAIVTNISYIMKQLGEGYSFIDKQYKINIGSKKNYIDILLFNYKFNNFVVIELKVREFRKEDIGQIRAYMNYIDKEVKTITQSNTIGILITKEVDKLVARYIDNSNIALPIYEIEFNNILEEVKE